MVALDLHCFAWVSLFAVNRGLLLVSVFGLLIVVASLVEKHGL